MAHFRGTIRGQRGEASRLGNRSSGLNVGAASYQGAVEVYLYVHDGRDFARIRLVPHVWEDKQGKTQAAGTYRDLYDGPVGGRMDGGASDVR